jgi:hypothetical protein
MILLLGAALLWGAGHARAAGPLTRSGTPQAKLA